MVAFLFGTLVTFLTTLFESSNYIKVTRIYLFPRDSRAGYCLEFIKSPNYKTFDVRHKRFSQFCKGIFNLRGISEYIFREIRPSASRLFNVSVSTLGEISGIALPISLNLVASFSDSTQSISIDHLPENRATTFRTGHDDMPVYFLRFSLSGNLFIIR